jgi:hypothetical protein
MTLFEIVAQGGKIDPGKIGLNNPVKNADTALLSVLNTVYMWAGIIAVLVIIVAGIIYTASQGEAPKVKRDKEAIIGACAGLVIIIMAFTITQFILGRF